METENQGENQGAEKHEQEVPTHPLTEVQRKFYNIYFKHLKKETEQYPERFRWLGKASVASIATMIVGALSVGNGLISPSVVETCKELQIKPSYKALKTYLNP